ncbi:MAG TPA: L,D-transpeptidase family protein [Bellilinea sp.]|nr:L,D-transpeptidase family protein [Bellilinea sp.]
MTETPKAAPEQRRLQPPTWMARTATWFAANPGKRVAWTLLALLILWLGACLYIYYMAAGPIAAGTQVGGVTVGGMSPEQAARKLDNEWNRSRVLRLTAEGEEWPVDPMSFGLWVDPNASAQAAYLYGRGDNRWGQILRVFTGRPGPNLDPVVLFSASKAKDQLAAIRGIVERTPEEPSFEYINGAWTVQPGAAGMTLDLDASVAKLQADPLKAVLSGELALVTAPSHADLAPYQGQLPVIDNLLQKPLKVQGYDPIADESIFWDVPRELVGSWLRVSYVEGQLSIRLDETGFGPYLTELERDLPDGKTLILPAIAYNLTDRWRAGIPDTVTTRYPSTRYEVQAGDTLLKISYRQQIPAWMILKANPGMNAEVIHVGTVLNIPSRTDLIPLPVVMDKRIKLSISEQHLWVYENGQEVRDFVISTGMDRSPTQPGVFQTQLYDVDAYASVWDLHMPHFIGIYQSWEGFWNGTHGLPTLRSGNILWAGNLGRPVSYGCIILGLDEAEWLFGWAPPGTIVEIVE